MRRAIIYVKPGINFNIENELELCNDDIELSVVKSSLPYTCNLYILNIYRPPAGDIDNYFQIIEKKAIKTTYKTNN